LKTTKGTGKGTSKINIAEIVRGKSKLSSMKLIRKDEEIDGLKHLF
jgi:hypothetical protein